MKSRHFLSIIQLMTFILLYIYIYFILFIFLTQASGKLIYIYIYTQLFNKIYILWDDCLYFSFFVHKIPNVGLICSVHFLVMLIACSLELI